MQIELRALDTIRPYDKNPRKFGDDVVAAVATSIKEFGFRQPIVVDADGVIIIGHVQYRAALILGLDKAPIHVADLPAEKVRALRVADNATGELSDWDYELLPLELEHLKAANVDLGLLGFSAVDLAKILDDVGQGLTDPDEIPDLPVEAITKRGDLIILGDHRLMCGDGANPEDVDRLVDGALIDLVHTDPPYNVDVQPRGSKSGVQRAKDRPLANDHVSPERFAELLFGWFSNIARVLAPGRSFYIWGGFANFENYAPHLKRNGLKLSQSIVWVKNAPVMNRKDFMTQHEWCFYGWRDGAGHVFYGEANVPDVWELSRSEGDAERIGRGVRINSVDGTRVDVYPVDLKRNPRDVACVERVRLCTTSESSDVWEVKKVPGVKMIHLTEKPTELACRAMKYSTLQGERVADFFGGSGSTVIAAEQLKRRAYVMEIDPRYCDVIVERWEKFTGRKAEGFPHVVRHRHRRRNLALNVSLRKPPEDFPGNGRT
ncbi:MAG: DNA modification methylase [Pirellulales bacterium]